MLCLSEDRVFTIKPKKRLNMKQKVKFRDKYDDLFNKKRNKKLQKNEEKIIPGCLVPSDYVNVSVSGHIFKILESRESCWNALF